MRTIALMISIEVDDETANIELDEFLAHLTNEAAKRYDIYDSEWEDF